MIRFEILLPLFYNDGRSNGKSSSRPMTNWSNFSLQPAPILSWFAAWLYQSTVYQDQLIRVRIDVEDTPESWQTVRSFKETLKTRFDQVDIWITAHRIEVV